MNRVGQALVLFALFLTVLLGISALAIDYANWLLIDRRLQNVSDHASLAGASVYNANIENATCGSNPTLCGDARLHAWVSLDEELSLGLSDTQIACLAADNTPSGGWVNASDAGCTAGSFDHRVWVSTPPPGIADYTGVGGALVGNFGIVWVRVDQPTRTFLGGVFGIQARDRIGWATAGVLPYDYALEVFCRDEVPPQQGVCSSGQGAQGSLAIDGGGGISIDRGDIGSSNSLWVSSNIGYGVAVRTGNVFVAEGKCGDSGSGGKWNCPPQLMGGIWDGIGTAKDAYHIPPLTPEYFQLPDGVDNSDCTTGPCVPGTGPTGATPIDWSCSGSSCGFPVLPPGGGEIECRGVEGSTLQHLAPVRDETTANFRGTASGSTNNNIYRNINSAAVDPSGITVPAPPAGPTTFPSTPTPADSVYSTNGDNATYLVRLETPNGTVELGTQIFARFVLFKTNAGTYDSTASSGYDVTVTAQLMELQPTGWTALGSATADLAADHVMTAYQIPEVSSALLNDRNNPTLGIRFSVTTTPRVGGSDPNVRGAGISWAEAYLSIEPTPLPPPMIPPGLYRSITIDGGCAVLDPTGLYSSPSGLQMNQMPGVYYFKDDPSGSQPATIDLGTDSILIGDGVSLVFDPSWPDPNGTDGIVLDANAALVINTGLSSNQDCTAWSATNQSYPLCPLPADALAAAWMVDPANPGTGAVSPWGGPCPSLTPCLIARSGYAPTSNFRGVSFYFRVNSWPPTTTSARFQISGSTGSEPGIAFRGVLYAPWDNIKLTGGNGFDTIGQVIAWTAKFAGQATISLDYPYARCQVTNSCLPYLLEPTVGTG